MSGEQAAMIRQAHVDVGPGSLKPWPRWS